MICPYALEMCMSLECPNNYNGRSDQKNQDYECGCECDCDYELDAEHIQNCTDDI